jgi:hypothetical protein
MAEGLFSVYRKQAEHGYVQVFCMLKLNPSFADQLRKEGFNLEEAHLLKWDEAKQGLALEFKMLGFDFWRNKIKADTFREAQKGVTSMPNIYAAQGILLVPSGKFIYEQDGYDVQVDWAKNVILGFSWKNATQGYASELKGIAQMAQSKLAE